MIKLLIYNMVCKYIRLTIMLYNLLIGRMICRRCEVFIFQCIILSPFSTFFGYAIYCTCEIFAYICIVQQVRN